jgi:hypothetical protein
MKKFVPLLLVLGAIAVTALMFLSQPDPVKAAAPEAALAVKTQILKSTSVTLEDLGVNCKRSFGSCGFNRIRLRQKHQCCDGNCA